MIGRASPPMDLPDIVASAWNAYLRHWPLLMAVALLGAVATGLANFGVLASVPNLPEGVEPTAAEVRHYLQTATPYLAGAGLMTLFTHLALVSAALHVLRGEPDAAVTSALAAGVRAFPAALLAWLAAFLVIVSLLTLGAVTVIGILLLGPLAVHLFVGWLLTPQFIVDERLGPFAALGASRRLVRGLWWRTCAIGLSVLVLYAFPSIIISQLTANYSSNVAVSIVAGLVALVSAPFLALGHTQLYLDNRLRKDAARPAPPPTGVAL